MRKHKRGRVIKKESEREGERERYDKERKNECMRER